MAYQFIPWVKSGTVAESGDVEDLSELRPARIAMQLSLRINDRYTSPQVGVQLIGPGDITSIDARQIVRVDPPHLTMHFEPNYFPAVEFRRPDFPWMFTPATGDVRGRLRPWLCLVVVRVQDGVRVDAKGDRPLPVLTIAPPARPAAELPNLEESWAWAHAQVLGAEDGEALVELLESETPRAISRLLCPVELNANARYYACVVPSFEAGRRAGLGVEPAAEDNTLAPAWRSGAHAPVSIELPLYFHWDFATGPGGDFESLALRLRGAPIANGVGRRDVEVERLGFGVPDLGRVAFEGALRVPQSSADPNTAAWQTFRHALGAALNATTTADAADEPVVGPPIYGSYHAATTQVPAPGAGPAWLAELNLDPRLRAAAGLGTLVVQDQQEALMTSAWEQLAGGDSAPRTDRRTEFAREIRRKTLAEHLAPLPDPAFVEITAPVHAHVTLTATVGAFAAAPTLDAQVRAMPLPRGMITSAFRTTFRSGGPITRRVATVSRTAAAAPLMQRLVERATNPASAAVTALPASTGCVTLAQIQAQLDRVRESVGRDPSAAATRFRTAADQLRTYLEAPKTTATTAGFGEEPSLPLSRVKDAVLAQLDPDARASSPARMSFAAEPAGEETSRILRHPEFPQPMYEALRDLSAEFLLPGAANVAPNTVTMVETNPRFIASFMLGLNHEMSRELLWREYPTNQRGTYFTRFWDVRGGANRKAPTEISAIQSWDPREPLGRAFMSDDREGRVVLLMRADLFRRYPNTVVYAVPATSLDRLEADALYPLFRGALDPDMVFVGFDLTEAQARGGAGELGYFFIIQEQPAEPRFGLGNAGVEGAEPALNSAHFARARFRTPTRIALHASELLPPQV